MFLKTTVLAAAAVPVWALGSFFAPSRGPASARLAITLETVHAAALTTPRFAGDAQDEPFFLLTEAGSGGALGSTPFPADAPVSIRLDQALGTRPLRSLALEVGESARIVISALEGPRASSADEAAVATAAATVLARPTGERGAALATALGPLTSRGAHLLGAAIIVVANEDGALYWRSLDCVANCSVLTAPSNAAVATNAGAPHQGVLELTGAGGTYHVNLLARRVP
ncbi:MAG: hypothetical protein K8S21_02955 [Gemmatimonadetes bacterium]|nr:hypothetical protein [Gemmatimonadota bacterium]